MDKPADGHPEREPERVRQQEEPVPVHLLVRLVTRVVLVVVALARPVRHQERLVHQQVHVLVPPPPRQPRRERQPVLDAV